MKHLLQLQHPSIKKHEFVFVHFFNENGKVFHTFGQGADLNTIAKTHYLLPSCSNIGFEPFSPIAMKIFQAMTD